MSNSYKSLFSPFDTYPELAYLDSAASTLTLRSVEEAMSRYYGRFRANVHRGLYTMSVQATECYEQSREIMARMLNVTPSEVVFTRGATDAFNQLADMMTADAKPGEEILISELEHHSNMLPWQKWAEERGLVVKWIPVNRDTGDLDYEQLDSLFSSHTRLVVTTHLSNSLGTKPDIKQLASKARKHDAWLVLDASQSMGHMPHKLSEVSADVIVGSGHKMYGPTGVGFFWAHEEILNSLTPAQWGGEMVKSVSHTYRSFNDVPHRFEAGTPPIAEAIGLGEAANSLEEIGLERVAAHEQDATTLLGEALREEEGVSPWIFKEDQQQSVISFTMDGVHPHDIAEIANSHNVALRAGHHCTMPLMKRLGVPATARASVGLYTDERDIEQLRQALREVKSIFGKSERSPKPEAGSLKK